jgi:ABC-type amino acid transport substrate-binding protein
MRPHHVETAMPKTRNFLLAGAALIGLAGTAAMAQSSPTAVHEITVRLPGGGVEEIRYTGDVKPQVVVVPNARWADPFAASFARPAMGAWPGPNFAQLDRISAEMNQRMEVMLHRAQQMRAAVNSGQLNASFANMPSGGVSYSQISTWSGKGVCTRTVRMTQPSGGKAEVVSSTSGNCASGSAPSAAPAAIPAKANAVTHRAPETKI